MTTLIADPGPAPPPPEDERPNPSRVASPATASEPPAKPPLRGRRLWALIAIWVGVILASLALTLYLLEPLFQSRTQSELLDSYRSSIEKASNEAGSLQGVSKPTKAPELGSPVAVLEIGGLRLQQVVVEGGASSQTQAGPGHVAGTAAPGQPGNAVVMGRRYAYGGSFNEIGTIAVGEAILITTTQGQVVYTVESVGEKTIKGSSAAESALAAGATGNVPAVGEEEQEDVVTVDELYGASDDDRLTLVTSASAVPWNSSRATVVVAKMEGQPFEPTPQGGRTDSQTGLSGDSAAWAPLILALLGFAAAAVAAVYLYRRSSFRVAYLLTTPPLIVFTILMAETVSRMFPSWM